MHINNMIKADEIIKTKNASYTKPSFVFKISIFIDFIVFQFHLFFKDSYKNVEGVLRATFKQYHTCLLNAIYTGPQATRRSRR